jgi:hypothetical protein
VLYIRLFQPAEFVVAEESVEAEQQMNFKGRLTSVTG